MKSISPISHSIGGCLKSTDVVFEIVRYEQLVFFSYTNQYNMLKRLGLCIRPMLSTLIIRSKMCQRKRMSCLSVYLSLYFVVLSSVPQRGGEWKEFKAAGKKEGGRETDGRRGRRVFRTFDDKCEARRKLRTGKPGGIIQYNTKTKS